MPQLLFILFFHFALALHRAKMANLLDVMNSTSTSASGPKPQEGMYVGIIGIAVVVAATILLAVGILCRIREYVNVSECIIIVHSILINDSKQGVGCRYLCTVP